VTGMFLHFSFARFYWLMLAVAGAAAVITLREMDATDAADAAEDGTVATARAPATSDVPAARPQGA